MADIAAKPMNRRHFLQAFAIAASSICLGTATVFAKPPVVGIQPGLHPGETLSYNNELRVTFINVVKDTRCPINARCVSAGDAEVALRIAPGDLPAKTYSLHTNRKPTHLVIPADETSGGVAKSYIISINRLTPEPVAGAKIKPSEYRLSLKIKVAQ